MLVFLRKKCYPRLKSAIVIFFFNKVDQHAFVLFQPGVLVGRISTHQLNITQVLGRVDRPMYWPFTSVLILFVHPPPPPYHQRGLVRDRPCPHHPILATLTSLNEFPNLIIFCHLGKLSRVVASDFVGDGVGRSSGKDYPP